MAEEERTIKIEAQVTSPDGDAAGWQREISALPSEKELHIVIFWFSKFILRAIKKIEDKEGGEKSELITDEFSRKKKAGRDEDV